MLHQNIASIFHHNVFEGRNSAIAGRLQTNATVLISQFPRGNIFEILQQSFRAVCGTALGTTAKFILILSRDQD